MSFTAATTLYKKSWQKHSCWTHSEADQVRMFDYSSTPLILWMRDYGQYDYGHTGQGLKAQHFRRFALFTLIAISVEDNNR